MAVIAMFYGIIVSMYYPDTLYEAGASATATVADKRRRKNAAVMKATTTSSSEQMQ
jgi:hypothetical protein